MTLHLHVISHQTWDGINNTLDSYAYNRVKPRQLVHVTRLCRLGNETAHNRMLRTAQPSITKHIVCSTASHAIRIIWLETLVNIGIPVLDYYCSIADYMLRRRMIAPTTQVGPGIQYLQNSQSHHASFMQFPQIWRNYCSQEEASVQSHSLDPSSTVTTPEIPEFMVLPNRFLRLFLGTCTSYGVLSSASIPIDEGGTAPVFRLFDLSPRTPLSDAGTSWLLREYRF